MDCNKRRSNYINKNNNNISLCVLSASFRFRKRKIKKDKQEITKLQLVTDEEERETKREGVGRVATRKWNKRKPSLSSRPETVIEPIEHAPHTECNRAISISL